ncbi:putative nuclease HARBI1 [Triplophysa rosa]|uniref:Nuclease HARBI1 n=1 Tax=Triplophysa rosa TaxID=992332 RepID=A0A9W7THG6_TRIRA|nr:putative nuclease HARBI1 [Triplophysa rosa]
MACPCIEDVVDEEAVILCRELHLRRERIVRPGVNFLTYPNDFIFERYRFSRQSKRPTLWRCRFHFLFLFFYISILIRPHIMNISDRGRALTSEQILCVALRFLANSCFLHNIGDAEHISKATVCRAIRKVCLALKRFLQIFVVFPGHKPLRIIKEEFHRIPGFPNVVECIDGTHSPLHFQKIICDAAHIITNVEAKWPGSIDGFLLGDRGYPCLTTLMTPYPEPEPGPQQRFNVAHCWTRTRARVEMTIGLLKARFQCLRHLRVTPERACNIIVACVFLHNIAIIRGEQHHDLQIRDPEEDPIHPADVQDGRVLRYIICHNAFSD